MAPHAVPCDADTARVELLKCGKYSLGELVCDVAVHLVSLIVWSFRRVHIETGTGTEVVRIVLTLDIQASCKNPGKKVSVQMLTGFGGPLVAQCNQTKTVYIRTGAGVRIHDSDALLTGTVLEEALF